MASAAGKRNRGRRAPRDPSDHVSFEETDFDILDLALMQDRELRLCAGVVKAARAAELTYPISSARLLARLLPRKELVLENHRLRAATIQRYLPTEYFPIRNEAELISRCYVALVRCRAEQAWAAQAPADGGDILREFGNSVRKHRNV